MATTQPGVRQSSENLVAILDGDNFRPLFDGSHPMGVTVRETSKLTSFPVEDGTERTDHRVLDAVEIDLPLLLTDETRNLYESLKQAYLEGRNLIIQTMVSSYANQMIFEIPHEETPSQGQAIAIAIRMREVRVVEPQLGPLPRRRVQNPSQSSTVDRGNQQTTESSAATQRRASVLYDIVN